jgi:hypothetical protein
VPSDVSLPDLIATDGPRPGVIKRTALFALAFVFFVLGVIFWLLPIATGVPFYIASLATLGIASRRVARWINRQETRLPLRWRFRIRKMLRRPHEPTSTNAGRPSTGA